MATWSERQQVLEQMSGAELEAFQTKWGGTWYDAKDHAKSINSILRTTEKKNLGNELDRLLGIPTDTEQQLQFQRDSAVATEQQLQLQRETVEAAKSSKNAARMSALCAFLALVISIIAIWVSIVK